MAGELSDAVDTLHKGSSRLVAENDTLNNGAAALTAGTQSLNQRTDNPDIRCIRPQ